MCIHKEYWDQGIPGEGKTWCMMYVFLYAISKVPQVITTAIMFKQYLQPGGIYVYQIPMIPIK